jgi:hypothetical protein
MTKLSVFGIALLLTLKLSNQSMQIDVGSDVFSARPRRPYQIENQMEHVISEYSAGKNVCDFEILVFPIIALAKG